MKLLNFAPSLVAWKILKTMMIDVLVEIEVKIDSLNINEKRMGDCTVSIGDNPYKHTI